MADGERFVLKKHLDGNGTGDDARASHFVLDGEREGVTLVQNGTHRYVLSVQENAVFLAF